MLLKTNVEKELKSCCVRYWSNSVNL